MLLVAAILAAVFPRRTVLVPDLMGFDFSHSISEKVEAAGIPKEAGSASKSRRKSPKKLPGWADQADALIDLLDALVRKASPKDASGSQSHSKNVSLPEQLQQEGHRCVDLVGHSYGGYISTIVASKRPDLIRRVGLICPAGFHRYRFGRSASFLFGPEAVAALLKRRLPGMAIPPSIQVLLQIGQSSGVIR